jgi:outer membrane protein insertion porin family
MVAFRPRLIAVTVAMLTAFFAVGVHVRAQSPSLTVPSQTLPSKMPAPGEVLVQEVRVEGNHTTPVSKLPQLRTRVGQPFDAMIVQEDVRTLATSRKFLDVKSQYQSVPGGMTVIFQVVERATIEYIDFCGNQSIRTQTLRKKTELEEKQPLDPYAVEEARRKLEAYYHEKGYNHAYITIIEGNKTNDHGVAFLVDEGIMQRVRWTSFEGNTFEGDDRLRLQVKMKPGILWLIGGKVDSKKIVDDTNSLTAYYRSFGYFKARVRPVLNYNESKTWLDLKFVIDEGPRYNIRNVSFIGNEKYKVEELNKGLEQISGKPYNQLALNRDKTAVSDIYGEHGYIFADVQPTPRLDPDKPEVDLVWEVTEGKRYRVGDVNINITGDNPHTKHATILDRMSVHPGEIVNTKKLRDDERRLKFASIFNVDPSKGDTPKITFSKPDDDKEEGVAGRNNGSSSADARSGGRGDGSDTYRGQSPDDEVVIRPYENVDEAGNTVVVWVPIVPRRVATHYSGESVRYQSPDYGYGAQNPAAASNWNGYNTPSSAQQSRSAWDIPPSGNSAAPPNASGGSSYLPRSAQPISGATVTSPYSQPASPYSNSSYPAQAVPTRNAAFQNGAAGNDPYANAPPPAYSSAPPGYASAPAAGQPVYSAPPVYGQPGFSASAPVQGYQQPPVYQSAPTVPPGVLPPPAGQPYVAPPPYNPPSGSPPITDPNGVVYTIPDPTVNLTANAAETQTGRLMLGVGVNSDAGLVGNFVLDEQNFDITRLPRSWEEVSNGSAWRGAGQKFRLEANPGTIVQRYAVTFQEPYLLDTPLQFGVSGFYFTRIYQDWSEGRVGGNVKLGYALTPDLTARVGFDGERVDVYDPHVPTPAILQEAVGQNDRYGFSVGLSHDTRDSPFLPTQGHMLSVDFEQVVGTFEYPRVIVEGRQYFNLRQRADGSGRHVLGVGGVFGVTGDNTPIYDNFFAGGFSSLRGFAFRGASPTINGVQIGGQLEALGTVEYMFPITADDALRGVVFCDFGTVSQNIAFNGNDFRAAPGIGLRITIPAMGPAPIALDLAFPVASAPGDQIQNFSFFVGLAR